MPFAPIFLTVPGQPFCAAARMHRHQAREWISISFWIFRFVHFRKAWAIRASVVREKRRLVAPQLYRPTSFVVSQYASQPRSVASFAVSWPRNFAAHQILTYAWARCEFGVDFSVDLVDRQEE